MDVILVVALGVLAFTSYLEANPHRHIEKRATTKCFEDIGCFTNGGDFFDPLYRPIDLVPQDREFINVKFRVYTPTSKYDFKLLKATSVRTFNNKDYNIDPNVETKIIVHGYIDNQFFGTWMKDMAAEFMKRADYNVIVVDWSGGNLLPYIQAAANTRLVGAEMAFLVNTLVERIGLDPGKVHLLGHSLGGQIVGYAGERISKLGRITSFDPAEPYFQDMPTSVRIDPTDAEFVEVVHTDSKSILFIGFGMSQLAGHVDFFPNNGIEQPGCNLERFTKIFTDGLVEGARRLIACNHQRAVDYVMDSINSKCPMVGFACNDWTTFLDGQCASCGKKGDQCAPLGINSDSYKVHKNDSRSMKFYLKTNSKEPFCLYHYQVTLRLMNGNADSQTGNLYLTVNGEYASEEISLGKRDLHHGAQYTFLATTPTNLGSIEKISFRWKTTSSSFLFFRTRKIIIQKIRVVPMNDISTNREAAVREYCIPSGTTVESGKSFTFKPTDKC